MSKRWHRKIRERKNRRFSGNCHFLFLCCFSRYGIRILQGTTARRSIPVSGGSPHYNRALKVSRINFLNIFMKKAFSEIVLSILAPYISNKLFINISCMHADCNPAKFCQHRFLRDKNMLSFPPLFRAYSVDPRAFFPHLVLFGGLVQHDPVLRGQGGVHVVLFRNTQASGFVCL